MHSDEIGRSETVQRLKRGCGVVHKNITHVGAQEFIRNMSMCVQGQTPAHRPCTASMRFDARVHFYTCSFSFLMRLL